MIIAEFTDNKYLALKPASCEARHLVEHSLGVWEREEDLRRLPVHNPLVLSQRPIKTTARKTPRYVPCVSLNPSQTSVMVVGMRMTPLLS